jgi:subtilisin family serine protease
VQLLVIGPPANATADSAAITINISIGLADGTSPPGRIKVAVSDDGAGAVIDPDYATNSATIQGHPGAAGAVAVGAVYFFDTPACGTSPPLLEPYSSVGGTPILFDRDGNAQTPVIRQKPELVAPDGGNDTFLGYVSETPPTSISECQSNTGFPKFFGTSAATPHAAAVAALMRQANAALTPTQLYTVLESTAIPMGSTTPNVSAGYGFIQAQAAFSALPPGAVNVVAPPAHSSGGGAMDALTVLWLASAWALRQVLSRRASK